MSLNVYLRSSRLGVDRALYRCRAIGVGPQALREAALHLLRTGTATAADLLNVWRGKVFIATMTVATAAGTIA